MEADEREVSGWGLYGLDVLAAAPLDEPNELDVLGAAELEEPNEPAELGAPEVGKVGGRGAAVGGLDVGAACGRKLEAPERGAGLGGGVAAELGVAADSSGSGDDTGAGAGFDVAEEDEGEGPEKPEALGRLALPPLAMERMAAASAAAAEDAGRPELSLEPLDGDEEDGGGADRNGVTVGAERAAGPAPERAAADPEDDDMLDSDDDAGEKVEADVETVAAVSLAGAAKTVGLDDEGRAEALVVSSVPFEASLDSPDFTSDALTVIGDAPPPGLCRDVLSGR